MTDRDAVSVAIVGGGAAGFFCALALAEAAPHARIVILEAAARPLQKVRISGGGRCNLTHACFEPRALSARYPRGDKALLSLFSRFGPAEAMAWFEARGLPLVTEADGRVFPASGCSEDVISLFLSHAQRLGVSLRTGAPVASVTPGADGEGFELALPQRTLRADAVALASGYSPGGWRLAASLGHRVVAPVPSLFPFRAHGALIADLAGVALREVAGSLWIANERVAQARGDLLITHQGVSGPLAYQLSAWGARMLAQASYQAELRLDIAPDCSLHDLTLSLGPWLRQNAGHQQIGNAAWGGLPKRFWRALLTTAGIDPASRSDQTSNAALRALAAGMKGEAPAARVTITGKSPSKEEFVSCGGVALSEVNFKRMESRIRPGLHFAGEILDIDGLTGGFNFQACWSAGWVAAQALASQMP